MKKTCKSCKKDHELKNFSKDKTTKDGLQHSCKTCKNIAKKDWAKANREEINRYSRSWLKDNPDKAKQYSANHNVWRKNNRDKINKSFKKRMDRDPLYRLYRRIGGLIRNAFKNKEHKKTSKTTIILDCTIDYFKTYIESKWECWMTWENYGKYNGELKYGWDLDHIIPVSSAKTKEEIIKLNHYTNFQPLCSKVNRYIKSNK